MIQYSGGGKTVETTLQGKERIYSREDTMAMVQMATSAQSTKQLMELGKFIYDATKKQDSNPIQYTD